MSEDKKARLEKIQELLKEQENNKGNNQRNFGPNDVYPFWNMPENTSCVVRFLPDGNSKNLFPWVESQVLKLRFPGIVGEEPRSFELRVPCAEMWGLQCPVLGYVRKNKWFDDEDTKSLGHQYWKKRSWIMQGFVVEDNIPEEETPENPIRRFIVTPQVHQVLKAGYADPELEADVTDYEEGLDFVITKLPGNKGPNYTTSKFKRKTRALNEAELAAIDEYGLNDLSDYLPKKPTEEELEAIFELFQASLEGEFYDPDKWGHLPWRPRGIEKDTSTPSTPAKTVEIEDEDDSTESVVETVESKPSVSTDSDMDSKTRAKSILEKIQANKQQQNS